MSKLGPVKTKKMDLEKFLKQNREEIREDDARKEQSLVQFREWLSKHPFIVKCRSGKYFKQGQDTSTIYHFSQK